jgi:hypothetical protein
MKRASPGGSSPRPRQADYHDFFPQALGRLDYGVPLPWPTARPGSTPSRHRGGGKGSPLGAYYFGSFRNNYVDNRPEKRYRELESFPGLRDRRDRARRFAKLTGEVNLPPIRFAEVGTPAFYLSYARPALFAGTMLLRSPDGKRATIIHDVGAQLDLNFTVALRLPMVFSVGAGRGLCRRPLSQDRMARVAENHVGWKR